MKKLVINGVDFTKEIDKDALSKLSCEIVESGEATESVSNNITLVEKFLYDIMSRVKPTLWNKRPDFIFYIIDNKIIFEKTKLNNFFYDYDIIWSFVKNEFKIKAEDFNIIVSKLMLELFNVNVSYPKPAYLTRNTDIKNEQLFDILSEINYKCVDRDIIDDNGAIYNGCNRYGSDIQTYNNTLHNMRLAEQFLYDIMIQVKPKKLDNNPESIFYVLDKDVLFEYNPKFNMFWCEKYVVWSVIETKFNLQFTEIQVIVRNCVLKALNINSVIPKGELCLKNNINIKVENLKDIIELENDFVI